MRGTKTLQDLFTDSKVPRSLRDTLPVVTVAGDVAWVAGVAVSEDYRLAPSDRVAVLSARSRERRDARRRARDGDRVGYSTQGPAFVRLSGLAKDV